ncbi:hypothetical protein [Hylemonella gracilis]|uniref:hypothetical protein n=1 Tax=Hylemonella gracilis TaxID=80880 RepID=UPI00103E597E|nr:hypothetical protein [Hylemonella gracilis]
MSEKLNSAPEDAIFAPSTELMTKPHHVVSTDLSIEGDNEAASVSFNTSELANSPWDYHQQSYRYGLHGLIKYPAMMVPQMQGDLLDAALRANPKITNVLDPFVGAGTTLVESLARDLNFTGIDLNPLAILACQAKSGPLLGKAYATKVNLMLRRVSNDRGKSIDVDFPELHKWFNDPAAIQLSRIRRAICDESNLWARRLMWLSFAETVRAVSNSRSSTYKLHIRPPEELSKISDAVEYFQNVVQDSVLRVTWHAEELSNRGVLHRGRVTRSIRTYCGTVNEFSRNKRAFAQLIISSPPYGDNRSTVSYGQFSYLQLRWIPEVDLPSGKTSFQNAYAIDGRSLGGSLRGSLECADALCTTSVAAKEFIGNLQALGRRDLLSKSLAFLSDYERTLKSASSLLCTGGIAIWTLGDRMVGGVRLPLGEITADFLRRFGMNTQGHLQRSIPQKRTPQRNSQGATMSEERVLITKKVA